MAFIYITGISGSGKSTVRQELIRRGFEVHGTDEDGLAAFTHNETGEKIERYMPPQERTLAWRSNHSWKIARPAVEAIAKKAKNKTIFLCGAAANDNEVWDLFDKVFALTLDEKTLKRRIVERTNNDFGKVPHELEDILQWQKTAKADYERLGAITIDATRPIGIVVDEILYLLHRTQNTSPDEVAPLAKIVWDYLKMDQPLEKADAIVGLGSHDLRVAKRATELFLQGFAPILVFAGGRGRLTPESWRSEAEEFAKIAKSMRVPKEKLLLDAHSTNTGENIQFTRDLLRKRGVNVKKIIIVHKPYMTRRAYTAFKKQWPEIEIIPAAPQIEFENYPTANISQDEVINVMVGDLLRIKEYPAKGYQIPQELPSDVWKAGQKLISLGFNKYQI